MLEFVSNEHMLFPTPLWQIQIKGVDNDAIKEYCYHLKDNTEGVTISNRGGWHSKEILQPLPDALNELFSNFEGFVNDYCSQITGLTNLMLGNFWVNINQKYDYNRSHDHQNSILSGVYYVDCEGDDVGNFVAERDDTAEFFLGSYKNVSGFTGTSFAITPLTGFAFLMPSWVLHSVEQNLTDRDRISIAFNLVNPDVVPDNSYD
jgi:uncharacterized protein (TIGR02466 family)